MYVLSSSFNCKIGFSVFIECNRIVPSSQQTCNNKNISFLVYEIIKFRTLNAGKNVTKNNDSSNGHVSIQVMFPQGPEK